MLLFYVFKDYLTCVPWYSLLEVRKLLLKLILQYIFLLFFLRFTWFFFNLSRDLATHHKRVFQNLVWIRQIFHSRGEFKNLLSSLHGKYGKLLVVKKWAWVLIEDDLRPCKSEHAILGAVKRWGDGGCFYVLCYCCLCVDWRCWVFYLHCICRQFLSLILC